MSCGKFVDGEGNIDSEKLYPNICHGCVSSYPIYSLSQQNCQQSALEPMYSYNGQKSCCLMRKSNSVSVSIVKFAKTSTNNNGGKYLSNSKSFQRKNCSDEEIPVCESESEDSDAEFAVHECLRDLIKSRSVQAFHAKTQSSTFQIPKKQSCSNLTAPSTVTQPTITTSKSTSKPTIVADQQKLETAPDDTMYKSDAKHQLAIEPNKELFAKHDSVTCWSAPDYLMIDDIAEGVRDDNDEQSSQLDSPKDFCWSAPELNTNDFYDSSDDESAGVNEKGLGAKRDWLRSLPGSIFSDYDEPKQPSFLALDSEDNEQSLQKMRMKLQFPKSLALEESYNSMDIYVASPSPQREVNERELHEDYEKKVEHNSENQFASPSDIDFIDSADNVTDIPLGYKNFDFHIMMKSQQTAKIDENRNNYVHEDECLKESCSECCQNCLSHNEGTARSTEEITPRCKIGEILVTEKRNHEELVNPECYEQPSPDSEPNSSKQDLEDILKRFAGFKPYNSEVVEQKLSAGGNDCEILRKVMSKKFAMKARSVTQTLPNSRPENFASELISCDSQSFPKTSMHQSFTDACNSSAQQEVKKLRKCRDEVSSSNFVNRTLCRTQLQRSKTDGKLSQVTCEVSSPRPDFCDLKNKVFLNGATSVGLKKSQTLTGVNKFLEIVEANASGRRRLPTAPNQSKSAQNVDKDLQSDTVKLTAEANEEQYNEDDKSQLLEDRTPISVTQQHSNASEMTDWTPCEDLQRSISRNPTPYMDLELTEHLSHQRSQQKTYPQKSFSSYSPTPNPDRHFIYHKGFQECIPCFGENCFTAPYTPVTEIATFNESHYLRNRIIGTETNLQRPTSLPFNGLIRTAPPIQQRNNSLNFGHRQLPPLPVNSKYKDLSFDLSQISLPPTVVNNSRHQHYFVVQEGMTNEFGPKEDHRICYDTESVNDKSASLIEGSYFEDNSINGNYYNDSKDYTAMPLYNQDDSSGISSCCTGSEHSNTTHRVHSAFIPRHDDEVLLEVGDAVHVEREYDDHWCYGTNLRTGQQGIFPVAHVCETDFPYDNYSGLPASNLTAAAPTERDTFYLTMLASIEVAHHKGNDVLIQAMNKVVSMYKNREEFVVPVTVVMEISFRGIHIIDKSKKNIFQCPAFDFFYSLQNISFCGAHPNQLRYFGFITKHPILPRFACHVFLSSKSTHVIVDAIGRAFKRSYDEYMAFAHPTEDIYLE